MAMDPDKLKSYVEQIDAPFGPEQDYRQSLIEAVQGNPDTAAQALPIARSRGIPLDMAERNMEYLKQDMRVKNLLSRQVMKQTPSLGEWMRNRENARIAWDDIDNLTKLADLTVRAPIGGIYKGAGSLAGAVGTVLEGEEAIYGRKGYGAQIGKWIRAEIAEPLKVFGDSFVPEERRTFGTEVSDTVGQMVPMIVGGIMSGSVKVGAAIGAGQNVDQMATEAENEGATAHEKFFSSLAAGGVTLATQYGPLGIILGKNPFLKKMLEKAPDSLQGAWAQRALDLGGAFTAEAAQEITEQIMNNTIEHFVFNPDQEIMEDLGHVAALGGTAGATARAILMAITGAHGGRRDERQKDRVEQENRFAAASKLRERSPEKFKEAMEKVRGDADYFIPYSSGVKFFQSLNDDQADELRKRFPDLKSKIAEAANAGSDIMISQAEYLTYLAPLDTQQILSGVLKAHQEMDVLESFPDLKDVGQESPDPAGDELQSRLEKEARAAGMGRAVAEEYARYTRRAYNVLGERAAQSPEFKALIERRLGAGLSVTKNMDPIVIRSDEIDKFINDIRARRAGGSKKTRGKRRGGSAGGPVLDYLASDGRGVMEGSRLAKELANMGVTRKTHPYLFRKKVDTGGGLFGVPEANNDAGRREAFDGIPLSEFNDYANGLNIEAPDSPDQNGYVDPQWLIDQIQTELSGARARSQEDIDADKRVEDFERFLDEGLGGITVETHTNAQIKKAINDYNKGKAAELGTTYTDLDVAEKVEELEKELESPPEFKPEEKPAPIEKQVAEEQKEEAEALAEPGEKIEDFGEKIAGARKDVWKDFIKTMSEELPKDAAEIVLSKHFPAPDYDTLIEQGVDVKALATVKAMRDEIPAKPRTAYKLKNWADKVQALRSFSLDILEGKLQADKVVEKMKGVYALRGVAERIELYSDLGYPDFLKAGDYEVSAGRVAMWKGVKLEEPKILHNVHKGPRWLESFETRDEAIAYVKARLAAEPSSTARSVQLDIYQVTKTGEIIIGKKVASGKFIDLKGGFKTSKEARAYLKENEAALLTLLEKKKEVRPERRSVNDPRKGQDYRMGDNVTPEKFAGEFGFRGVQFGNYVEQKRRADDLNNAYDAMLDLANLINIPSRAVSLNGELGLAFGARGKGGKGAPKAHYEPGQVVINLTKNSGAGSLGHEWWHALDNFLGKQRQGESWLTEKPYRRKKRGPENTLVDDDAVRPEVVEAFAGVMQTIHKSGLYKRSKELDKRRTKDYWSTDIEMSARAFEAYLIDKAAQKGESNDYLANIVSEEAHNAANEMSREMGLGDEPFPYPTKEELATIGPAFDKLFATLKTRQTDRGIELFQGGQRGSVTYTPSGRTIIQLFQQADKSTLLHETGHIFLDIIREGAKTADAPESVVRDWDKAQKWFLENYKDIYREVKDYNPFMVVTNQGGYYSVMFSGQEVAVFSTKKDAKARAENEHKGLLKILEDRGGEDYVQKFLSGDQTDPDDVDQAILTAMDEQFARAHEAYLFEGKAPAADLVGMFRRFTSWLTRIYQSIKGLRVNINDDIRGIFDRILASDQAIEEVRALNITQADPNVMEMLNEKQKESYISAREKMFENAREKTIRRALRDADRETRQWWKDEEAGIMRDLTEKYENDPIYVAIERMRKEGPKINRTEFGAQYPEAMAKFPEGVFSDQGVPVEVVSEVLGFGNVDAFVTAMSGVEPIKDRVAREARIEMNDRHGDVFLDGRLEEVAIGNIMSEEAAAIIETELAAASRKTGKEYPRNRDFRRAARTSIETMLVKDARKPNRFLLATIRNAKKGVKELTKKKYEEYADAKRKELYSLNMYRETRQFVEYSNKADDHYSRLLRRPKAKTRPTIDPEYHRMIWRVLANFVESREPAISAGDLQAWAASLAQSEYDTPFQVTPDAVTAMTKSNFKNLTVAEYRAVYDLVRQLETKGRESQVIIVDGQKRDRRELINQMIAQIADMPDDGVSDRQSESRPASEIKRYLSIQTAASSYFEIADSGDQVGLFDTALKKGIDLAQSREAARNTEEAENIAAIFQKYYTKKELMEMSGLPGNVTTMKKTQVNGIWMSKMERICGLLNMGNEGNEEAFLEGQGWKTDSQREAFLASFEEKDFQFVQDIWDYMDKFWPEIAALEMKRYGHPPEKVETRPLKTPFGEIRGGYYPIMGDPSKSVRVKDFKLQAEMRGYVGYASTGTSRGHTIERVGVNPFDPMPLLLDFRVITKHVSRVVHDLEMGEPIAQVAKIIRDTQFQKAFKQKFGIQGYQQIDLWLKDVAAGNIMAYDSISSILSWGRRNMTIAVMGLSATTIISQVSGVTNSVVGMSKNVNKPKGRSSLVDGAKWLGVGYKRQFAELSRGMDSYLAFMDALHKKSPFMRDRSSTIMRDVREVNETWAANPVDTNKFRRAMMYPIGAMQKQAVDTATWLGAYEKFMAESDEKDPGKREEKAVRYADNTVRDYQSSGTIQDLSGVLRGTTSENTRQAAYVKMFTFAFNYFNNKFNRILVHTKLADFGSTRGRFEWARDMVFLVWMDALIADMVLDRLPEMFGDDDDKKKFTEGWGWWFMQQPISSLVVARDVLSALKVGKGGSPLDRSMGSVGDLFTQIGQGEADKSLLKAGVSAAGMTTGLVPSVQINRLIDLIDRADDGDEIEYKDFVRSRKASEK